MADLGTGGQHPREGVLVGAAGARLWQPGEAEPPSWLSAEEDPFAHDGEQVLTDLADALDAELAELLATVPLAAVDEQPEAPLVAQVEQQQLELSGLLAARSAAIDRVVAHDRREARLFAARVDDLVQVRRLTEAAPGDSWAAPVRSLALELGGARRLGHLKVESDVATAVRLTEVLPLTLAGLRAAAINVGQALAVLERTQRCTAPVASEVERRLWADPRAGLLCPSDLRKRLDRLVLLVEAELDPEAQADREAAAVDGRRVSSFAMPDGMAGMFVEWTAVQGLSFDAALDRLCRWVKADDEAKGISRTAAQRRADVLAQLPIWVEWLLGRRDDSGTPDLPNTPDADAGVDGDADPDVGLPFPSKVADPATRTDHIDVTDDTGGDDDPDGGPGCGPGGGPSAGPPGGPPPGRGDGGTSPPPVPLPSSLGPPGATVNVHIPLATALGLSDAPAYLERHGGISAARARQWMPHARMRPVHVDECGQPLQTESPDRSLNREWRPVRARGSQLSVRELLLHWARRTRSAPPHVVDTPEPQYEPSAALQRHLRERDMICTGPGCSQPARRCQLDHLEPYGEGGQTAAWNFGAKSERCHNAKTHGGWTTNRHADGSTTWTSPLGRRSWTPAFWSAPPDEDLDAPLPDPSTFDGPPPELIDWAGAPEDHAPGLRRDVARARDQRHDPTPPKPPRPRDADPYAYRGVRLTKSDTPPPF